IVAGQLRQTGPAAEVAAEPADPDVARLLGWSELGHGTVADGTAHIGQFVLQHTAPPGLHGPVEAFYRPEDIEVRPTTPDNAAAARCRRFGSRKRPASSGSAPTPCTAGRKAGGSKRARTPPGCSPWTVWRSPSSPKS